MTERLSTSTLRIVIRAVVSVALCVLLIGAAAGTTYVIIASEPTAQSETATKKTAALVETVVVERTTCRPTLEVLGVVEPARDVLLSPRVSGQIVSVAESFTPGEIITEGQELIRIDPSDYERALTTRRSAREQVRADLEIEKGRQRVALREFELLGEEIDPSNRALVLREPQIDSMRAELKAADAAVELAQLEIDRTRIVAPFDAQILSRSVNLGSQVSPGNTLARLVGTDEYWILASVPLRDLRWISFASDDGEASPVKLRHSTAWQPGEERDARVSRLIGAVDQETRLARVLVTIEDPLGLENGEPPLILGTIVRLRIEGLPFEDIVRLDREYLRQNNTVWVMSEGMLSIRPVEVLYTDSAYAYIQSGLEAGDRVVMTNLATVTNGLPLEEINSPSNAAQDRPDGS